MGRPYSLDLRERVVRAVIKDGLSRHQAAAQFGVGISTAINWVRRVRETGSVKMRTNVAGTLKAIWIVNGCHKCDSRQHAYERLPLLSKLL